MAVPRHPAATGSRAALLVLLILVVVSPWPFGSAHPTARWMITLVCLGTAAAIGALRLWRREGLEVPLPAVLVVAFFLFGLLQLVPLPEGVHSLLAPGSATLWHPEMPEAAAVLGKGPCPISIWPEATRRGIAFGLGLSLLGVLAMPALRERRRVLLAAVTVVASGLAVAVYGLFARLAFGDKLYGFLAVPTVAPFGPFVSKNHFAGYVEMTALLALGLATALADEARRGREVFGWIGSRRAPRVVLAYGAVAVLSLAVLVSLSRGGAVSLAVGIAAFALLRASERTSESRRRAIGVMGVSLVAAGVCAVLVLPPETRQRLQSIGAWGGDSSTAFRARLWRDALGTAAASPLVGYGLGSFADALPRFKSGGGDVRVEHAENDYIEIWVESGLVGFALALGGVVALGLRWRSEADTRLSPFQRALACGPAAGLVALAVHSMVDFNLHIPSNAVACVVLAALILACGAHRRERRWGTVALVSLGVVALLMVAQPPSSGRREALHAILLTPDRPTAASLRLLQSQEHIVRRVESRPADGEMWVWLGWSRAAQGQRDVGAALSAYGASLDPQRQALQATAGQLAR